MYLDRKSNTRVAITLVWVGIFAFCKNWVVLGVILYQKTSSDIKSPDIPLLLYKLAASRRRAPTAPKIVSESRQI